MTSGTGRPPAAPGLRAPTLRAAELARALFAGLMVGVIAVVFAISFTAIIYSGALAPELSRGIGLTLAGATLMAAVGALRMSYRGTIVQPQDVTAVIVALAAAAIADGWSGSRDGLFATVAVLVAATTALSGLAAYAAGWLRLGFIGRFLPYPVLGGFLAATGYLLTIGALGMATGTGLELWTIVPTLAAAPAGHWLPWLAFGALLVVVSRRYRHGLVLPGAILAAGLAFYTVIWARGLGLADAAAAGLLLGPFGASNFLEGIGFWIPAEADWRSLAPALPAMMAAAGMAIVGALLYASALEVATGAEIDPDRDLRGMGLANLAAAAGGGMVGYHLLSQTLFARALGVSGPACGFAVAGFTAATLVFGAGLISVLPIGLFAGVIAFLGIDLLYTWLWEERRRLPRTDFAIVCLILAVAATVGFLEAIATGIAAAAILFIHAYAGIDVVRLRTSAAALRSRVERPDHELRHLAERGAEAAVYQLTGYLFFGTASRLLAELKARLADPGDRPRIILLDFRRVSGVDISAAFALDKLNRSCLAANVDLLVTGLAPGIEADLLRAGSASSPPLHTFARLDDALRAIEERLLADARPAPGRPDGSFLDELARLHPDFDVSRYFERIAVPGGHLIMAEGDPADSMCILLSGRLCVETFGSGSTSVPLATIRPGALVGEIGLYAGTLRTARVLAEEPSELLMVHGSRLEALAEEHPSVAANFSRLVAVHLARRLMRTSVLLRDAEA